MVNTENLKNQSLFSISWPLFIELSLHIAMGLLATLMLGHYSDLAAAGVGVANQLISIFILVFNVSSIGAMILIGQRIGAQRLDKARQLSRSAFSINVWFGVLISLIVVIFGQSLLNLFDISGEVYDYALLFIRIVGFSLFLESISLVLSAILRSHGRTKEPMYVSLFMNIISTLGYVISIYGVFNLPITGVTGVSWTMVIARSFAVVALIMIVAKELALRFRLSDLFHINTEDMKNLFQIGIPSAGENLSYHFSQLLVTAFVATLGDASLVARVYLTNITMLCYLFSVAIGEGTQLLVARYIGGGHFDQALKRGMKTVKIAVFASTAVSLTFALMGNSLIELFTSDAAILAIALPVLWGIAFVEPGRAVNIVLMSSLKSAGDVRFPVIIGILSMWTFTVGFGYLFGITFGLGLLGIWIAQGIDEWFRAIFAVKRWHSRPWEKKFAHPTKKQDPIHIS
ncbi:MATE family efflux transporter [Bacillus sp. FJAT-27986]|uniref:MATE family efflux transporter n=1 Tax=Bacillus sp. FJAT-27986 TaxID=1743146 RepID=UPI00080AF623|nr:MATE family efflux transporter [Bacillus sp. FJAT-27986]OCA89441.1 MATE family efflux transporter [Bacillus sp. FJAT-27986]